MRTTSSLQIHRSAVWAWIAMESLMGLCLCSRQSAQAAAHQDMTALATELRAARSGQLYWTPRNRPRGVDLRGITQRQLLDALGAPDFCYTDVGHAKFDTSGTHCVGERRWVYFFYRRPPSGVIAERNGVVQLVVSAGGGWGLDMSFDESQKVKIDKWTLEE